MANEIRLRRNNMAGTITDNPLAQVSTTINSAGFVDLPTIGGTNSMILILDPLEINGPAEIVLVTAHTAAASSVTVTRGVEGSAPRAHILGTTWFHGPVTSDYIEVLTSSTRPTIPYEGELIYETDTDIYKSYNGAAWVDLATPLSGAWATYVPTNTNITVGNGTQTARFMRTGRMITVHYRLLWGTTTSFGGSVAIGLPVAAVTGQRYAGAVQLLDADTAWNTGSVIPGRDAAVDSALFALLTHNGTAPRIVNATNPFSWTTGDEVITCFSYEAAS